MFNIKINDFVNDITTDLDNKISKLTNVPNYDPSVNIDINVNTNNTLKGVIFCHGHKHKDPQIPVEIKAKGVEWTLVDISDKAEPDLVGGYDSWNTFLKLGLRSYDYVLSQYCPIGGESIYSIMFIRNMRWLLKNGGSLVIIPGSLISRNSKISEKILDIIIYKYGYTKYIQSIKRFNRGGSVEIIADNE